MVLRAALRIERRAYPKDRAKGVTLANTYVEQRDEGYWVANSRVSLDSIVYAYREGLSPETIATECFPTLTLEQVYGAIAYYLTHVTEIDAYLQRAEADYESLRQKLRQADPAFTEKLAEARRRKLNGA
jgi:uncharacterized protein (DUF433 family)